MSDLLDCDLVMKGGITSGVVYPGAIVELSTRYRFRSIGGASAGAIAATLTAAAEYARQCGKPSGGFAELEALAGEIARPGFIERLFQPTEAARPAFAALLRLVTDRRPGPGRFLELLRRMLLGQGPVLITAVLGSALWLGFGAVAAAALVADGLSGLETAALTLLALVFLPGLGALWAVATAGALAASARRLNQAMKANGLGVCPGTTQAGYDSPALTDWLYEKIQRCAGLPLEEPLTFRRLEQDPGEDGEIELRLITTDLSYARPVDLPLDVAPTATSYLFDPVELGELFPQEVVRHMVEHSWGTDLRRPGASERRFRYMPLKELPVLVAARLSLSFPLLLSTVPLYSRHERLPEIVEHRFSDGGISSNFPIHFFDSLLPGRPTFGLDLQPYPGPAHEAMLADEPYVLLSRAPRLPRWSAVDGVGGFVRQMLDAARNWRDTMQSELPGFRDRICQVRLREDEGGLNLNMRPQAVEALVERGRAAGRAVLGGFDWRQHRLTRYRTLMQTMQHGLTEVAKPHVYETFRPELVGCDFGGLEYAPPDPGWCSSALHGTDGLVALTGGWGEGQAIDFDAGAPQPAPTLRITPRV